MPTTWEEIRAWQLSTANNDPWLARVVRALSIQYVIEFNEAKNPLRPSPISDDINMMDQRAAVADQFFKFTKAK